MIFENEDSLFCVCFLTGMKLQLCISPIILALLEYLPTYKSCLGLFIKLSQSFMNHNFPSQREYSSLPFLSHTVEEIQTVKAGFFFSAKQPCMKLRIFSKPLKHVHRSVTARSLLDQIILTY